MFERNSIIIKTMVRGSLKYSEKVVKYGGSEKLL